MSNFQCPHCGMTNIDCGKDGYKTPKEIKYKEKLEKIKEIINCDGYNKEHCIYCAEAHHCYTKQVLEIIESEN